MKCTIDPVHFTAAWEAIQPVQPDDEDDYINPVGILRVEAANGMLRLRGPYGNAEVPADVERPGVLFVPVREFVEATTNVRTEPLVELEASEERIRTNHRGFLSTPRELALFDVPDAPETWEPQPRRDDPFDEEEPEDAD